MKVYEKPEPPARVFLFTLGQRTIPMKLKPSILIAAITVILSSCSDLSHIDIVVESPNVVSANEEFVITNHIINYSQEIQEVYSLDISDSYLENIAVLSTTPGYRDVQYIPLDDTWSHSFRTPLLPNDTLTVELHCMATSTGLFRGTIDYCINSDYDFVTRSINTVVE